MGKIICPRCDEIEPKLIIGNRVNQLCPKCGNALFNIEETIELSASNKDQVESAPEFDEIEKMEVKELRPLAKVLDVKKWWNLNKKKLIKAIKAKLAGLK